MYSNDHNKTLAASQSQQSHAGETLTCADLTSASEQNWTKDCKTINNNIFLLVPSADIPKARCFELLFCMSDKEEIV